MDSQVQMRSSLHENLDIKITAKSISLKWDATTDMDKFDYFQIKYREEIEKTFDLKNIKQTRHNEITLCNLKSETTYIIKGFIITEDDRPKEFLNKSCRTEKSLIPELIEESRQVGENPRIFKLPRVVNDIQPEFLRECIIGHKYTSYRSTKITDGANAKTILVVGATGAGKSTFIDAMINHVVDVSLADECRFKMIDLTLSEQQKKGKEVDSQTSATTCYRTPCRQGFTIDYPLNIIDTPGFDDTRGKEFDQKIPKQIKKLFESVIHSLHAVCIVVPLSCARLTSAQKSVFKSILDLFGDNIKDIIYPCITHDDGGDTKCLSAMKVAGIPFTTYFRFNNSDLFNNSPSEILWGKRKESFKMFFEKIGDTPPRCLKNSERVLKTREQKTIQLESIRNKIRVQVQNVDSIKKTETIRKKYESEKESNKNFTYNECVPTKVRKQSDKQSVNCTVCKESCHKKCYVPFDVLLSFCDVFKSGQCTVCKSCKPDSHIREKYEYETTFVNETRTNEDIEQKYKNAEDKENKERQAVNTERDNLRKSLQELKDMLEQVENLITSLNAIALQRENFSIEAFFDELIDLEDKKKEDEYKARMVSLKKIKVVMKDNKPLDDLLQELST